MNTLLLLTVLLSPRALVAMPVCAPPLVGDWVVASDCLMVGNQNAPRNVIVLDGVTLQMAGGAALDIDFAQRQLVIGVGARVIIGLGGRIH